MSIEALPRIPSWGAREMAAAVHASLDRLPVDGSISGGAGEGPLAIDAVDRAIRRLQSVRLRLVAEADRRRVGEDAGMASTGAWLAARTRTTGASAAADVQLAVALDGGLEATREALAQGSLTTEHARVIASTAKRLPGSVSEQDRQRVETQLVAAAARLDPDRFRRVARRALAIVERSAEEVDAHEGELLQTEEERAWQRCRLVMRHNDDGTSSGHFTVPRAAADILRKVVQQLASPKRLAAREEQRGAALGMDPGAAQRRAATVVGEIDWAQRHGQALAEILEHLPTDRLPGKVAATIVITVPLAKLVSGLGSAGVDTGAAISAGQVRRLACQAGIVPAVLDGESLPIDLGRAKRHFSEAQRVSLATVHDECAADGCDRPFAWCDLHHETPWAAGGRTDLRDAVPLCGHHHRLLHSGRHHVAIDRVGGRKVVTFRRRP